jgi:ketosteroid isomerase-like protein
MRRSPTLALALLWLASPVAAPCQDAPDAPQLRSLLDEFLAGASRNDASVHERFWADSLVYTRSTGRRIGKADILKDVREAPPHGVTPRYSAEDVRIQQFGDAAVVAFRLLGTTPNGEHVERDEFLNTGTFVKRDGRWQAVAWQATRVPVAGEEAERQVKAFDAAFHAALLAPDVKTLGKLLDDGFTWTHSDGHKLTGAELVAELDSGALRYTKLQTSAVTTWVRGATAVVRGDSLRQRSSIPATPGKGDPEPLAIFYTLTLVHDGSDWKAVALHSGRK